MPTDCIVCAGPMQRHRHDWLRRCDDCGFLAATLPTAMNTGNQALHEGRRSEALVRIRRSNSAVVLDRLAEAGLAAGGRILDVGCGHGWFLEQALARGYRAVGIEPDQAIAAEARRRASEILPGCFPEALAGDERFDAIVFNDVFEHLPNPVAALAAVRQHLRPRGLLALCLPLATGALYRAADLLDRLGVGSPLERLWQRGFPSPHLAYFTSPQLARLAKSLDFGERLRTSLPAVRLAGLWQRLRYDRTRSALAAAAAFVPLLIGIPLLRLLPPDLGLQVFTVMGADHGA